MNTPCDDPTGTGQPPEGACRPDDILITAAPDGFLLARVLPRTELEPWWEYIKIIHERGAAIEHAHALARAAKTRVWFREGDVYEEMHD